ncbi:hypothetical protein OLP41_gp174 [Mycobacterium phage I3]|uniref:Uncharacterized protein n=1 Tax=Mycobacterium phage I3 TaxID=2994057 RepID=A0A8F2E824_9CAUD|nr:hypothetical protein OLP41_gp174 [Mycobacterium phage I3]QWT30526.1 hypothetical protein PBI_I3_161 [Mycobacterium phage I3]
MCPLQDTDEGPIGEEPEEPYDLPPEIIVCRIATV